MVASTTGQKTAAQTQAKAAPVVLVPNSHTFVAMQTFNFFYNGHVMTYRALERYVTDTALKTAISATSADVVWDS